MVAYIYSNVVWYCLYEIYFFYHTKYHSLWRWGQDLKLISINFSSLSAYQKILSWEPLLELVSIDFVEESERKGSSGCTLTVGDSLAMKIVINYNGPKVSALS